MRLTIADQFKRIKNGFDQLWEAQKALSESEAHYRSLFENVPIGIYRMQPDGTPIDVNPALVKMLGYPDKEALFSRPRVEFYVNLQDREAHLAMADSGRHIEPWELQMRCRDGSVIWVENEAVAVRDDEGRLLHYQGTKKHFRA